MKKAFHLVFEGLEGCGKTTQTQKLVDHLHTQGYKILQTKEPGTSHLPLTMLLRGIMLDKQYDTQLTIPARELISQAIRSIHLEKLLVPAQVEYDFIIQDRGNLSGLAYGAACGNDVNDLLSLAEYVSIPDVGKEFDLKRMYDVIIYLKGDVSKGLSRALSSKQEFAGGDAMEARGNSFMNDVGNNMDRMSRWFNTREIYVDGKSIDQVFSEILNVLDIKEQHGNK